MAKILVVDDEEKIRKLIKNILVLDNHLIETRSGFEEMQESKLKWYESKEFIQSLYE